MKINNFLFISLSLFLINLVPYAQDKKTTETKVAELFARLSSNDQQPTDKLMSDMLSLGESGLKLICNQVVPAGTGDDALPRLAIESLSRFLSGKNKENERAMWETICISYASLKKDSVVTDFFMKQFQAIAGTQSAEALKPVLKEFENGNPDIRDVCFKILSEWKDNSACSALFEICSSGNKTFEGAAFEEYIRRIKSSDLKDEQKLLLFRKIMPFALNTDRKNEILAAIGKLKNYQSLYFVGNYLEDSSTSGTAAKSAMNIALPSANSKEGLNGVLVKEILTQAAGKLKGQQSEYNKDLINKYLTDMPAGESFKSMFNGKDLSGWHGLVENPVARAKMKPAELAKKQIEADKKVTGNWSVKDGCIWFNGSGDNLCSIKEYSDFEMLVDWKITKKGDSGIYLRGSPQVQIWDTSRTEVGAQVGSGGLYNNQTNTSKPLRVADNPVGEWNSFRIVMIGEKVSVWLNGELVVDNVTLENYWDREIPIFPSGPIELQAHGTDLAFRDIYIREINEKEYNLTR